MKRAAQEAPSDYSGPFSSLTLPTHNDLLKILMGTIKKITDKPLSGCRRLFSRMHKRTRPITSPRTTQ